MTIAVIWGISITAQLLALGVGTLGRSGVSGAQAGIAWRRTPLFVTWGILQLVTSIGLWWINAAGQHAWYLDLWRLKQWLVIVPGALLATLEALRTLRVRTYGPMWLAVAGAGLLWAVARRPAVWPGSGQELIFVGEATVQVGLGLMLAAGMVVGEPGWPRSHAVTLAAWMLTQAVGLYSASLLFPWMGYGMELAATACWLGWAYEWRGTQRHPAITD